MTRLPQHEFEASDPTRLVARPDVSVGIITYNHEAYLAQAVESVLAQKTDFPFEIIIYEDCSTDATREIALDYQRRHPEIVRVVYSSVNVGMGENVKRGIAATRARYAAGVDGDDFWTDPRKLQDQFNALEANPHINLSFSRGQRLFPDGRAESDWNYGPTDRIVPVRELLLTPGIVAPSGSLFFRADILRESPEWIFAAPVIDLFHILAAASPNGAHYLARETVAYREMAAGSWSSRLTQDYDAAKVRHSQRMLESWEAAASDFGIDERDLRFVRSLPHYVLGRDALAHGRYGAALRHFTRVGSRYIWLRLRELPARLTRMFK